MTSGFLDVLRERAGAVSAALEDVRRREEGLRSEYADRLRETSEEATRLEAELRHLGALIALESGGAKVTGVEAAAALQEGAIPADLREETYKLLSEVREPMHYARMAEQLALRGVHIPGKEPAKNLVAHIHNDARFRRPRRGFYGLAEWYPKGTPSVGARRRVTTSRTRQRARQPAR
jgi:hypothetical protein